MAYEQRDNSGSLFANEQREKETHANARGSAMIDGVTYFVDAYTKTTGDGKKWQSLTFKRKDKQPGGGERKVVSAQPLADMADDCPF